MGIQIRVGFWLTAAGLLLGDRWGLLPPLVLGAVLHEGGHLAALTLLGIPVRGLELRALGAVIRAELRGEVREVWALAAGPGVNLLLAIWFRRLWPRFGLCSLALGLCNLLPLARLDGGRICALLLPRWFGARGYDLCRVLHWTAATVLALLTAWTLWSSAIA